MPSDDLREAIRAFREGPDELTPVINNFTIEGPRLPQPTIPDSDPPSGKLTVKWGHAGLRGAPAWLLLILGVVAILAAAAAYIATHL